MNEWMDELSIRFRACFCDDTAFCDVTAIVMSSMSAAAAMSCTDLWSQYDRPRWRAAAIHCTDEHESNLH